MKLIIAILPILLSYIFFLFSMHKTFRFILNICAYLSMYGLSTLVAFTVYDVLIQDKVFMTTIHKILLNPFFLITSTYIGIYILYLLLQKSFSKTYI
ncbi:hypothetical protein [Bacillus manliponensis]|uniref:hypothetical protein n=1 Tax=Bacillus manliponensis TaxID=574376 RepID=UPI003515D1EF